VSWLLEGRRFNAPPSQDNNPVNPLKIFAVAIEYRILVFQPFDQKVPPSGVAQQKKAESKIVTIVLAKRIFELNHNISTPIPSRTERFRAATSSAGDFFQQEH
jgi:hypothetical protein